MEERKIRLGRYPPFFLNAHVQRWGSVLPYSALPWEQLGLDKRLCSGANPLSDEGKLGKSGSIEVTLSQSVGKIDLCRYAKYGQHKSSPICHPLDSFSMEGNKVTLHRNDIFFFPQKSLEVIHDRHATIMN